MIPIEWFPIIARIILEQMKTNTNAGAKTDSFMTTNDEPWTPGSCQSVEDHIKEGALIREVVVMAAYINNQNENFSKIPFTKESIKSMRTMLFSKDGQGVNYLKNIILHNVRSQQNDERARTTENY